jgi:hypothetical protein
MRLKGPLAFTYPGSLLMASVFVCAVVLAACRGDEKTAKTELLPTQREYESSGCNEDWSYYRDANDRFSFCYPQDMTLMISRQEPYYVAVDLPAGTGAASEANAIGFSIFWRSISRFHPGPVPDRCRLEEQHYGAPTHEVAMTIAGQAVIACRAQGNTPTHGFAPLEVELIDPKDGGSLRIGVLFGPDPSRSERLIDGILGSLEVPARP